MSGLDVNPSLVERIVTGFLRDEAGKFGFDRAVLGVSGGIDSAVSAAVAARAFGPENVLGVMMPFRTSNPESEAHAREVIDAFSASPRARSRSRRWPTATSTRSRSRTPRDAAT